MPDETMLNQSLKKLAELDVFCLLVFKTLYENGHANTTANELQVSAPKVSRSLTILRATFNDELFYRRQQGLKPTPLSDLLYEPICHFCRSVAAIGQVAFNEVEPLELPTLNIAVTQSIMSSLAIKISQHSSCELLGQIRLHCWGGGSAELLRNNELDFGITFDTSLTSDFNCELIGSPDSIYVAARAQHEIWQSLPDLRLEDLAKHPFLYLESKGFNDKIDPFEMYCRSANVTLEKIDKVSSREAWFCHLMTMGSVAFLPAIEAEACKKISGLRTEALAAEQVKLLHGDRMSPKYYFIENKTINHRYTASRKALIIQMVSDFLKSK
ncbi:LysR family transcriptional regulator [Shewanella sp. 1CM18E]|uniref:LysR family transcriptional regulator n=1 Tax=Shewanella sp. 1CM18E TaxID=2929169 RepID=UPI0020C110FF|nr:LysR family transcriptional regulator [Shewanella sp. 1CM18E]MCK8043834.1 LysR family transcriptional regulator [Shewanella sp. 1CM18E]